MNPLSTSTAELGTKDYPYKEIESAFVEITNFHFHSERNISVFVMEGSTVFVKSPTYIVNITNVHIESYSEKAKVVGLVRLVGVQSESKIISKSTPTKFNILGKRNQNNKF